MEHPASGVRYRLLAAAPLFTGMAVLATGFTGMAVLTTAALAQSAAPNPSTPSTTKLVLGPTAAIDQPAHMSIVEGTAMLERDGRAQTAVVNAPILAGDRIRTRDGRVEVVFADGSTIDVDQSSTADFLSDSLLRLIAGRVRLQIARGGDAYGAIATPLEYRVDTQAGSITILMTGEYRVAVISTASGPEVEVAVWHGAAEVGNGTGRTVVRAGTLARAGTGTQIVAERFNVATPDNFDQWTSDEHDVRVAAESTQNLPSELGYYSSTLDQYGTWDYLPAYGAVWYPSVDASWHPYYNGQLWYAPRLGWTWVGVDQWAWPTHHYGRWGLSASSRWYWIPGRQYAPAWVSWAYSPGYVSWCPLGYNDYPVVGVMSVASSRGWSVVPAHRFGPNVNVPRTAVAANMLPASWRSDLAPHKTGPAWNGVVGGGVPLRAPGGRTLAAAQSQSASLAGVDRGSAATARSPQQVQDVRATPQRGVLRLGPPPNDVSNRMTSAAPGSGLRATVPLRSGQPPRSGAPIGLPQSARDSRPLGSGLRAGPNGRTEGPPSSGLSPQPLPATTSAPMPSGFPRSAAPPLANELNRPGPTMRVDSTRTMPGSPGSSGTAAPAGLPAPSVGGGAVPRGGNVRGGR
jgi:Family of unknown function (DUF6600)/FecR protein